MSLPTLLKPGSIVYQKWMTKEQKQKLETSTSIEWIIEYLEDRAWSKTTAPKIKIKGPGSRVSVFRSGTGTGKSTVFPPYIYNKFFEDRGLKKNIICTQPTVATATDIPYQIVMFNKNLIMGVNIGFQTGSLVRKPVKGILFATIGILLQHLKLLTDEEFMRKYSYIILDEIHLRSVETDTTLFYLRRFLDRNYENPDCPYIILTSGTFEPEIFMDYFSCPKDAFLDITGSSFPISDHYAKYDLSDYMTYAADLTEKIHIDNIKDIIDNNLFRDILIFVQGGGQIKDIVDRMHKLNAEVFSKGLEYAKTHSAERQKKYGGKVSKYYICPVAVTSENMQKGGTEYQNVFSDISSVTTKIYKFDADGKRTDDVIETVPASRRVIIATNVIETGLTIDTLKYCIDTGYVNESQFNPNFGVDTLINKNVTQASARQRRGRVGRKDPGEFYTCYTKKTYDELTPLPFPDIVRADITSSLLDIIINETSTTLIEINSEDVKNHPEAFQMNNFDQRWYALDIKKPFNTSNLVFIQSPAADSFTYALEKLRVLGFIDHAYRTTVFGWFGSKFRKMKIEDVRMILAGYHHGANILDLITISCMVSAGHKLGIKKNKYKPRNPLGVSEAEISTYYKVVFADEFIEYLFIWNDFLEYVEEIAEDLADELKKGKNKIKLDKLDLLGNVEKWCTENKFDTDTMLRVISARDDAIGDLLNLGMNPFYNGLSLERGRYNLVKILNNNLTEGMEEVRKIKNCIYDGYRMNLYIWNEGIKSYVSPIFHNTVVLDTKVIKPLILDETIKQSRPQKIIISGVALRPGQSENGLYEFMGSDVCSLDGFVEVDVEFVNW